MRHTVAMLVLIIAYAVFVRMACRCCALGNRLTTKD